MIRISGPQAEAAVRAMVGRVPPARQAALATLRTPGSADPLDQALLLWFPAPASETGEDMAEFQVHGGRAVVSAVLRALGDVPGLRPAEAGEFTRRALENGKLSLTAVEGLADLIGAETDGQRRQALRQLSGALHRRAEGWRETLINALALVEAALDFSDQEDVDPQVLGRAKDMAAGLAREIEQALADGRRGERIREGLTIALAGPPNAGKSTLFNWLAGREAAIVSPYPGTTRDVLEVHLDIAGYPVTVLDTAGLRDSDDPVELEGMRRAQARAAQADLTLWVEETDAVAAPEVISTGGMLWRVRNKADLLDSGPQQMVSGKASASDSHAQAFVVSAKTGAGLEDLMAALADFVASQLSAAEPALVTRERHRLALSEAAAALQRAGGLGAGQEELFAEDLRITGRSLERLLGRVDVEDVLDVIFRDFCVGK